MRVVLTVAAVGLLVACTTTDEIIIDRKGVDPAKYEQDLAECRCDHWRGTRGQRGNAAGSAGGEAVPARPRLPSAELTGMTAS